MSGTNPLHLQPFDYVGPTNPHLDCPICRSPFVDPVVVSNCQHVFCSSCLDQALQSSASCPIDRRPVGRDEVGPGPRVVGQMCDELRVKCGVDGCDWEGERGGVVRHWAGDCAECEGERTEALPANATATEEPIVHPSPSTECPYCLASLPTPADAVTATATAPTSPHPDPLPAHLLSCELVPVPCPFAPYGCPTRLSRAQLQFSHLSPHHEQPCAFQPLQAFLTQFDRLEDDNRALRARCEALEEGMREMREVMEGVKRGMGEYWVQPASEARVADSGEEERASAEARAESPPQSPPASRRPAFPAFTSSASSVGLPLPLLSTQTPLPSLLAAQTARLATLDASLTALDSRHTQARTDATHALRSEMHDLRQGLLAVRAQVMHLHVDQARRDAMQHGGTWRGPLRGGVMRLGGEEGEEGGSASGSDDEMGGPLGRGYGLGPGVGMGMGMGLMDGGMAGMAMGMGGMGPPFGRFYPSPPLVGPTGRPMYSPPGLGGSIKL